MVKKLLDQFCGVGIRSYFLCPVFLPFLKFVIGHIARYAPSSKFQNQQKYRSKLLNLFFHHYLRGSVLKIFGLEHFQTVMIMVVLGNGWGVGWWS